MHWGCGTVLTVLYGLGCKQARRSPAASQYIADFNSWCSLPFVVSVAAGLLQELAAVLAHFGTPTAGSMADEQRIKRSAKKPAWMNDEMLIDPAEVEP